MSASEGFEIFEINELGRDRFSEDVSNKIFILDLGNISDPIQIADAGFYIFKITRVSEEAVISFEDAKIEIEEELSNQIAYELYDKYINEIDMQLINGAAFDEIANQSSEILNMNIDDLLFQNVEYSDFKDMLNNNAAFESLKAVGEMSDLRLTDTSMYFHVMRCAAHVTFCALIINYLNDKRPISSLGPVVIFFYTCVFFEIFAFLILEFVHGVNFDFRILLSIFFLLLAIFTHRANLKKKQTIFRD